MGNADHLIKSVVEAWNSHEAAAVTALHAAESIVEDVSIAPAVRGAEAITARAQMFIDGIGDLRVIAGETLGSADRVVYEWHVTGFHTGSLLQIPATGRPIDVPGMTIFELDGEGMIVAERLYWNALTLLAQIGAA